MQSLIHGNFEGRAQKRSTRRWRSCRDRGRRRPLIGGAITTYLSWRVAFLLEAVVIAVVLSGIKLVRDVPYTRRSRRGRRGCGPVDPGHGRRRARDPVWQEGGESVAVLLALGVAALAGLAYWLVRRKRAGHTTLLDPDLFRSKLFRLGVTGRCRNRSPSAAR